MRRTFPQWGLTHQLPYRSRSKSLSSSSLLWFIRGKRTFSCKRVDMLFPSEVRENHYQKGAINMSTSLLYHAFGLRGYDYVKTEYQEGGVIFTIRQRPHTLRCPVCNSRAVLPRGHQVRTFKTVPIGRKPVSVVLAIPRVECPTCGIVRQVPLNFADPRRSYTQAFER